MDWLTSPWVVDILSGLLVSGVLFVVGFFFGKYREKKRYKGNNLELYDFYPFNVDHNNHSFFDLKDFRIGVYYFLKHRDYRAARQLILIGEQNQVREQLGPKDLEQYLKLYSKYSGDTIFNDTEEFLTNYKNIVRLIGESFPDTGIEILLHDLSNPAKSLVLIENNVTGRKVGDGATNLLLDLKMRRRQNQDKLNYELNIGSRRFKCTTIPIIREEFGIIAAICINIDANYLTQEVLSTKEKMEYFITQICKMDMKIDENILSKNEFEYAKAGKKHWRDHSHER